VISFRYHVVSLVAVLLALAVGVALGGGPLSEIGRGDDAATERAEERGDELDRRLEAADSTAKFQDDFAQLAASRVVQGSLEGRPVALVTLPGADEAVVTSLTEFVQQAGGSVAGSYALQPALVDGGSKPLVDTLGTQLLETVEGTGIPANATTYDRIGQLLGRAVATGNDTGSPVDTGAEDILSSLRGAELVTQTQGGETRASLALVVLGDESADTGDAGQVLGGLFAGLATHADGVVVAGTTASATGGVLQRLRDEVAFSANVSTVDSVQSAAGRVNAVLALAADMNGTTGHYGAAGIDGSAPRG
jgi:hypothetical protein